MSIELKEQIASLLEDEQSAKVLVTVDGKGIPHAKVSRLIHSGEDGRIVYMELLESSQTNRNLTGSLWFNRKVSIAIGADPERAFQVKGIPTRVLVAGPVFQEYYVRTREKLGDVDLAAVWFIEPSEVIDESTDEARRKEETDHPFYLHLDRIAK